MSNEFQRRLDEAVSRLPREREPAADLWPGIAARLDSPRRRWAVPASLAAALAAGLALALWLGTGTRAPETATGGDAPASLAAVHPRNGTGLIRMAAMVDRTYRAALLQSLEQPRRLNERERQALAAELDALDGAQVRIRAALRQQPDAEYLVFLLVQTHALRLDLVNRLAGGPANSGGNHENGNA